VPLEVLETELGYALLDGGGFISAAHARMMACDCKVVPMVLGQGLFKVGVTEGDQMAMVLGGDGSAWGHGRSCGV
jgi:hypothetical protein